MKKPFIILGHILSLASVVVGVCTCTGILKVEPFAAGVAFISLGLINFIHSDDFDDGDDDTMSFGAIIEDTDI